MRLIIFTSLIIFCGSCNNHEKIAGLAFNKVRMRVGLPLLDSTWHVTKNVDNILQWFPSSHGDSLLYLSKLVEIKNDKVAREENHFLGKEKYTTVDGTFREQVYVSCYFDEKENISDWDCEYEGPPNGFRKNISKAEADSILRSWNLFKYIHQH